MISVLFVCTGNICRSPTADGVLRKMVNAAGISHQITVDSAGTHGYHIGDSPDPRSRKAAQKRGYDLSPLRARKVNEADFTAFTHILAMDSSHLAHLLRIKPDNATAEIRLFLTQDVPDPYYGGPEGFEAVLDMVEAGCAALLKTLTSC
jgi:protein-tyrosine phosphatase